MTLRTFFRLTSETSPLDRLQLQELHERGIEIRDIHTEECFYIAYHDNYIFDSNADEALTWILAETFEPHLFREGESFLLKTGFDTLGDLPKSFQHGWKIDDSYQYILEIGPRLAFSTAWSSNCMSMLGHCGVHGLTRIERSCRYAITSTHIISDEHLSKIVGFLHDRMTECVYDKPLTTFDVGPIVHEPTRRIPVLDRGEEALRDINKELGLGFDEADFAYYTHMFQELLKRDPTVVECFDLGQSNSEHSRHWFFNGKIVIDNQDMPLTLFKLVKNTLPSKSNSVIAFHDNSSAIYGFDVNVVRPTCPTSASPVDVIPALYHPILTAETHNFPCGVAPFPGAETGTGGRLRDIQATGRGAHTLAGINGYCVGNLSLPHYELDWESRDFTYPSNLAHPSKIIVEASSGASDYGNKFGEPVVAGFTRSFGQVIPSGDRIEWIKPIMFTAGVGMLDDFSKVKGEPAEGMIVCKVGGPAYRIGMGGGAASSRIQGTGDAELDFNAVQRGDAEMEGRMNRVIRACIELGEENVIVSIHDQGAGGNGNVLKEIVDPLGAHYELRKIPVGDPTLTAMEIWGAEYQENNAFLIKAEHLDTVLGISERENCPVSAIGIVASDGVVVVYDDVTTDTPFNMPLSLVLGKMPQKTYNFKRANPILNPITIPENATIISLLEKVLRLVDVSSKRFLTNKVDRSVTGLVAQQPCVGPLQIPVADVAVLAQSHFSTTGVAVSVGEQPIKGLVSPQSQARLTVIEALSNLVFAKITRLEDIKASCNWMWAAKLETEGSRLYDTCQYLCDCMTALGISIDGGKDSLSMAATVDGVTVKAPGQVTLTCYAPCSDIRKTITPDLKVVENGTLLYLDLGKGKSRLGGTALSTVLGQLGDSAADFEDFNLFREAFECIQELIDRGLIVSGHDRSDGGLIVTLLEMAFAGNCGLNISIPPVEGLDVMEVLFGEEPGFVFEIVSKDLAEVQSIFSNKNIVPMVIGCGTTEDEILIHYGTTSVLGDSMTRLRDIWEETSFELEKRQCNPDCVLQEKTGLASRTMPPCHLSFTPELTSSCIMSVPVDHRPRVAVIREEGSNGDREMLAAFHAAGFQAWDVNMDDLLRDKLTLDRFRGVAFVGGFSYADANGSAKGWGGVIRYNQRVLQNCEAFRNRSDTFSLGVCNGCQLMTLLGWVPFPNSKAPDQQETFAQHELPRFIHNKSGRFESRWLTVKVVKSPAVLLKGMEGSTLGICSSHGEGRVYFPRDEMLNIVEQNNLAPIRYVNDQDEITEAYPFNPNGSQNGIAALCSPDGRHLAIMTHPERTFLAWQMPYIHPSLKNVCRDVAPWIRLFQNAYTFCTEDSENI